MNYAVPAISRLGAPSPYSLGGLMRRFKAESAKEINRLRQTRRSEVFQRGYFDRVIRTPEELEAKRIYIRDNPKGGSHHHWWDEDDEYTEWI